MKAKIYNKKEIFDKVLKIYTSGKFYINYIEKSDLFPLEIKLKKLKQSDLRDNYSTFINELNSLKKENFELEYREFNFKSIGFQKLPIAVHFKDENSFLNFISKSEECKLFKQEYKKVIFRYPDLKKLLLQKPFLLLDYAKIWDKLLLVCDFFINNPRPNIYTRELSIIGVDTKFIQKNQKVLDILFSVLLSINNKIEEIKTLSNFGFEKKYFIKYPMPIVRFRILDENQKLFGLSDISVPIDEFKKLNFECENIFIVENKITTLSFPQVKNSMVIFGSGYGIEILKDVECLHFKKLFYWGDIDRDGFAILSQVRAYYGHIHSIFMDEEVIKRFSIYATKDTNLKKIKKILPNLNEQELIIYDRLVDDHYAKNFRLEQEKVHLDYIKEKLELLF